MNKAKRVRPSETAERLCNPERGMYSIFRYILGDDPGEAVNGLVCDQNDSLLLVEINLGRFTDKKIPSEDISSAKKLFELLGNTGKQLIVRFLYDWDGNNLAVEPRKIDLILSHIEQLAPVISENTGDIYLLQGLFIGRWGEMHGSRYLRGDHIKRLYSALSDKTGGTVNISVRTPEQWRCITGYFPAGKKEISFDRSKVCPGLFNDGIMGSESDLGTYRDGAEERIRELDFQDKLCRVVPNGGEVVSGDKLSEPVSAMKTLAKMHISYLNRDYDRAVLDKWENTAVSEPGIWNGMNYLEYADLHLGYRFVISKVSVRYSLIGKHLAVNVTLKNAGFAPLYLETAVRLTAVCGEDVRVYEMEGGDLRDLCGIGDDDVSVYTASIPVKDLASGTYELFFGIHCLKYDCPILTANEGYSEHGCIVGRFEKK